MTFKETYPSFNRKTIYDIKTFPGYIQNTINYNYYLNRTIRTLLRRLICDESYFLKRRQVNRN
jgi:hypothetical protein